MYKIGVIILSIISFCIPTLSYAETPITKRIAQFSNNKVNVWQTIIYPSKQQILKMHRHEYDRVLISFDDGVLKVINNKGKVHYLKLKKEQAYYLPKDFPGELHTDENIGKHPIKVSVIELKQ